MTKNSPSLRKNVEEEQIENHPAKVFSVFKSNPPRSVTVRERPARGPFRAISPSKRVRDTENAAESSPVTAQTPKRPTFSDLLSSPTPLTPLAPRSSSSSWVIFLFFLVPHLPLSLPFPLSLSPPLSRKGGRGGGGGGWKPYQWQRWREFLRFFLPPGPRSIFPFEFFSFFLSLFWRWWSQKSCCPKIRQRRNKKE